MEPYNPAEDSCLLADAVKWHANGRVLDMGTGSGIQAETALKSKRVVSVTATDINKSCKEHIKNSSGKIKFICSDLFSKIPRQRFDTIVFNPPYLPQDRGIKDARIYGGKKGYELLEQFLNRCNDYLATNGLVLTVFSSLTGRKKVDEIIESNCLESETIAVKELPFVERLFVYKIRKTSLLRQLERVKIGNVKKFAEGKRGIIYTGKLGSGKVAIKAVSRASPVKGSIASEAKWLRILNRQGIGPKIIGSGSSYFIYKFVEGKYVLDFISGCGSKSGILETVKGILRQCRAMDQLKVNKGEMTRPHRHAIVSREKVTLLDFERCRKTERPKNVTQFCQFLSSGYAKEILRKKGIEFDSQKLLGAARKYKNEQSDGNFGRIINLI